MGKLDNLRVRQLDDSLAPFRTNRPLTIPSGGWARTIREALGMSIRQLAERTGMSKTGVASAESFEAKGSVQMDTLRRLAEGLDCELVYALVPRTSLAESLRHQARQKAECIVARVSDSMDLEAQGVADHERLRQIDELTEDMLRNRGREFWNV